MFLSAVVLQNLSLMWIGMAELPQGAFEMGTLVKFAGYSFLTSMPVLSFMVFGLVPLCQYVDAGWVLGSRVFERYGIG